ncbi:MAG: sigma-54-dependent Fis family transcriptional regulator [Thermodesulfovibrionales bacterium]
MDINDSSKKKLSVLYEIALTVGKSLNLKMILDDVLDKIVEFMRVDAGVIYVINDDSLEMIPVSFKNISDEVVRDLSENRVKIGECMCGNIAQCDQEVIIPEKASDDPRFTRGVLKKEGMEFYAGLPLKAKNKVVGVLCVINHTPYTPDIELLDILRAATVPIGLAIENARMFENTKKATEDKLQYYNFEGIISSSTRMTSVLNLVRKITNVSSSILIYGESGTGKELIAKAIHFNSLRKERPFIAVNCAAIPETLLESELFGYVKGAFTGATADKIGLFEAADSGSILLDEVEGMSKNLQVKILRFLQERTLFRVGSTKPLTVDVRIIAASNQDLGELIKAKLFREDLFYRLNVIRIDLPPLRERVDDIPLLTRYFINRFNKKMGKNIRRISEEAMDAFLRYSWPGNIRELENSIERAVAIAGTHEISKEDISTEIIDFSSTAQIDWNLEKVGEKCELEHITKVLNLADGNKKQAAKMLGLDATTLWRKMKKYGIAN